MNEQNLPKNTKKEVKETAVPVVSNDPQEVISVPLKSGPVKY